MPVNKITVMHTDEAPSNVVTVRTTKKIIRRVPKNKGDAFKETDTDGQEVNNKTANTQILKDVGVLPAGKTTKKVTQKTRVTKTTVVRKHRVSESKLTNWVAVDETQRMSNEKNVAQATAARATAIEITEKPLSQIWNRLNRIIPQMLFGFNLIVSIIDLAVDPIHLHFKVTALIFSIIENIILAGTWFFKNLGFYKNADDNRKKKLDKQLQYLENIIQEVLIYPTLLFTLFSVVVGQTYNPNSPQASLELILLTFDIIALIYIYGIRIYMVRKIMRSIKKQLGMDVYCAMCHITTRFSIMLLLNSILFGTLMGMLGLQIHTENGSVKSANYSCSGWTVVMIAGTLVLPLTGVIMFCVVNYYWFLEMFILINLNVTVKNDEIYETAEEVEAPVAKTILEFSIQNTEATKERLNDIRRTSGSQKYFYALREWKCCVVLVFYTGFACLYGVAFNASYFTYGTALRFLCVVFVGICNYQVASLVLVMVVYLGAFLLSWLGHKCGIGDDGEDEPLPSYDEGNNHVYSGYRMPNVS